MSHFGVFCPPVPGHVNPFCALGRTLVRRGHRVTVFHMEDLAPAIEEEGLSFVGLRDERFPPGALSDFTAKLASLQGMNSLRFTIEGACRIARLILDHAPAAVQTAAVDALLVDQNEPAGGTVAEHLGLPFLSVCTSLPINRETAIPPSFVGWKYGDSVFARLRNRFGYSLSDRFISPIQETLNRYRKRWGLVPLKTPDDSFSRIGQIAQMPSEFDFPRKALTSSFHYCGPWFDNLGQPVAFPYEKLDGRPLIYGSLGTLQQKDSRYFKSIAEACSGLDAQLILSLGRKGGPPPADMVGNPIVVNYAPQLELLSRAAATITHSGMNTTQQSLYFGVPLVAIPLAHDQPAIASRLARTGTGIVIPRNRFNTEILRSALRSVLRPANSYRQNARRMQDACQAAGGVERAADIAESIVID
jgi:zeaxanthin glucosyltransferase